MTAMPAKLLRPSVKRSSATAMRTCTTQASSVRAHPSALSILLASVDMRFTICPVLRSCLALGDRRSAFRYIAVISALRLWMPITI